MPNLAVDVDSWARSACYPRSTFYPLSDGLSTQSRRITRTWFPICSTCWSRSQACFCSCTQKDGCRPSRADLRAPPLPFRRRPPQSNCPPDTVPTPDNGRRLGCQRDEGGIPRVAPRRLASSLHSLPPILYTPHRQPMSSCSKGSRGLSVHPRVSRIFTTSAISPGPWSRQRPNRYAFRAGRNLPDKEFRYLRTVIVTAAVYRGLGSLLRTEVLTTPRDLPAPGRRQTLYVAVRLLQSPVFLINSRLGRFTAAPQRFKSKSWHARGRPFSRSYGTILPSSLTMVLPIALVCSTHPPVSVCGTGSNKTPIEVFLGSMGLLASLIRFVRYLSPVERAFDYAPAYVASRGRPEPRRATLLRHPIGKTLCGRRRNICLLCIGYSFRSRLSSRLTLGGLALPRKPWVYGGDVSHVALATHASILTSDHSTDGYPPASPRLERSPTRRIKDPNSPLRRRA